MDSLKEIVAALGLQLRLGQCPQGSTAQQRRGKPLDFFSLDLLLKRKPMSLSCQGDRPTIGTRGL